MRLLGIAFGLALLPTAALSCDATKAAFDRVKTKMTLAQVVGAIGCAGEVTQETETGGFKMSILEWGGVEPHTGIIIMMSNGRVLTKNQIGLR